MFGDIIQMLRNSRNYSQVQLAEKLGISKQTVSNWENNNILPSIDMLLKLSKLFSVSCDYLLEQQDRTFLEISDLTVEQISHIQQIIDDIKKNDLNSRCEYTGFNIVQSISNNN